MLNEINVENILFLDIETVPQYSNYDQLPDRLRKLWDRKAEIIKKHEEETSDFLYPRAGIYAEFGKIICISSGFLKDGEFRIKSFYGEDEQEILSSFAVMLSKYYKPPHKFLCAHNGKEFDFPYLSRRMLVLGISLPDILNLHGKKPWEVTHLDTMQLWKFGDYKSYTSLDLLTAILDVPTPKDDIDGSDVGRVYWEEKNIERIKEYCQKDALAVAQIFMRYLGQPLIQQDSIRIV